MKITKMTLSTTCWAVCDRAAIIRDTYGYDMDIAVDFHGRVHKTMAKVLARELDRFRLMFIEEPVLPQNNEALREIANHTATPITVGERMFSRWEYRDLFPLDRHHTGIGREPAAICMTACKAAKARGVTISCDLNFRKKLWTSEKAGQVMGELMPYVDVCIANEEDVKDVFGIHAADADVNSGKLNHESYISVARQLAQRFGCGKVAITLRGSISAADHDWAGMLYSADADRACFSTTYHVHIVDRAGGGDSFGGGLIYSLLSGYGDQKAIDFAVAASCLKHSIEHGFNHVSAAEVTALAAGNVSGRIQR